MNNQYPLTRTQKRSVLVATVVMATLSAFLLVLIDDFGTWTPLEVPTLREAIGLGLVVLLTVSIGSVTILRLNPDESLQVEDPTTNLPLVIRYGVLSSILLGIDGALFGWQGLRSLRASATSYQSLVSVILSALLVLLYYDQHQTQRQQVELMTRQIDFEERQLEWRETQQMPRIDIQSWNVSLLKEPDEEDAERAFSGLLSGGRSNLERENPFLFSIRLSNNGETRAQNLKLYIEPLIASPDFPSGYHNISLFTYPMASDLHELDGESLQQHLGHDGVELDSGESAELGAFVSLFQIADLKDAETETVGDAIRSLPFTIDDVVFRAILRYDDVGGKDHEQPIAAVRLLPDQVDTLAQAFSDGDRIPPTRLSVNDVDRTREIIEERYAQFEPVANGIVQVNYDLQSDHTGESE